MAVAAQAAPTKTGGGKMGIEIERKFKVAGDGWRGAAEKSVRMAQGYVNDMAAMRAGTQKASVRVRIAGDRAFLNLKSRELGHTRQEFDYEIPLADGEALLALCVGGLLDKTRHYVRHAGFLWEVDEFHGESSGLVVAEIELPSADTAFGKPDWTGEEVTEQLRYYNLALAERPYSRWSAEEKA
jgi:adenylate cyclase